MVPPPVAALNTSPFERELQAMLWGGCEALLRAYGLEPKRAAASHLQRPLASQIDFRGGLHGQLTLVLDHHALLATLPIANGTLEDLEDWSRELVNQLMGFLKDELQAVGYPIWQRLPRSVSGLGSSGSVPEQYDSQECFQVRQEFETGVVHLVTAVTQPEDWEVAGIPSASCTRRRAYSGRDRGWSERAMGAPAQPENCAFASIGRGAGDPPEP